MDIRANTFAPLSAADNWTAGARLRERSVTSGRADFAQQDVKDASVRNRLQGDAELGPAQQSAIDELRRIDRGIGNVGRVRLPPASGSVNEAAPTATVAATAVYGRDGRLTSADGRAALNESSTAMASKEAEFRLPASAPSSVTSFATRVESPAELAMASPVAAPAANSAPSVRESQRSAEPERIATPMSAQRSESRVLEARNEDARRNEAIKAQAERLGENGGAETRTRMNDRVEATRQLLAQTYQLIPAASTASISLRA
jgi:hypothetical protein